MPQARPTPALVSVALAGGCSTANPPALTKETSQQNALTCWPEILEKVVRGRRPVLFLDYDGTLAPIVRDPERAFMSDEMRATLKQAVEGGLTTAIISGRSREKVQAFVQVKGLFYAGSHGFDISGPAKAGEEGVSWQVGDRFRPLLELVRSQLEERCADVPGSAVEDNKYALSVHYRNVVEAPGAPVGEGSMGPQVARLFSAVSAILEEHGDALELRRGKMVFELRPKLEWNKGCALMWILGALSLTADAKEGSQASLEDDICPFYLGDDITDEDAFLALRNLKGSPALGQGAPAFPAGVGVLVRVDGESERPAESHANFKVRDPSEVQQLVALIAAAANAYHEKAND